MTQKLTVPPGNKKGTFLDFPLALNLEELQADFAILGIPFGMPYDTSSMANDQADRKNKEDTASTHAQKIPR